MFRLAILTVLIGLNANARTVEIAHIPAITPLYDSQLDFAYNKELGRAWVRVMECGAIENSSCDDEGLSVEGLRYDPAQHSILYENVVCAKIIPGLFGIENRMEHSGLCQFKVTPEQSIFDNGFRKVEESSYHLTLEVK
jgi:hypothetical protein